MTEGTKNTEVKNPEHLDLGKARTAVQRIVDDDIEWLKEMAKR